MTLQQMEYIVAVNRFRHFVKAAESLGVSQSTLSMMIRKLEDELDTIIFDRDAHPIKPTAAGEKLIAQAEVVLFNAKQFSDLAQQERSLMGGVVKLGIIPTVSANIVPMLFQAVQRNAPDVELDTYELKSCDILEMLQRGQLDMALMATPLDEPNFLEIPVYYEHFYAYVSPQDPLYSQSEVCSSELPLDRLWTLQPGNCLRDQVFNMCSGTSCRSTKFEAGSLDTIIRIVDKNGGFTIIPELHIQYLCEQQKKNIRPLSNPSATREISLVIRKDYVREALLNQIAGALKFVLPPEMVDSRLKRFAIHI